MENLSMNLKLCAYLKPLEEEIRKRAFDVHGSVHRNINLIERTNKMQPCSRIYYSNVS